MKEKYKCCKGCIITNRDHCKRYKDTTDSSSISINIKERVITRDIIEV